MTKKGRDKKLVLWFKELNIDDVPIVGGKNASLGEMYQTLTKKGIKIPYGFATTSHAYKLLLKYNKAAKKLKSALSSVDINHVKSLTKAGKKCREIIMSCKFPDELTNELIKAYEKLSKLAKIKNVDVAVRSSATAEDLPTASFAGQQETYLNIKGIASLLYAVKKCFASLFTNRAIAYRIENKFNHMKVYLSVGVQRMVRSDKASSGVMFSIDTETGFKNAVFINGSYGLGESVVQGLVNPDEFYIFKPTLKKGYHSLISKKLGSKARKMIYSNQRNKPVKLVPTLEHDKDEFCISDLEALKLAKWAVIIEDHYSKKAKKFTPMDIEWAKDGKTGELFIVQARPETVQSQKDVNVLEEYKLLGKGKVLCLGKSVGTKIGQGKAHIINDAKDIHKFKPGEVLVTDMTDPDWVPAMRIAGGIVTNKGGRTCFGGNTKILTNKGILSFKELFERHRDGESFFVWSVKTNNFKSEWKKVESTSKNKLPAMRISCSQTGRVNENSIETTPTHKFYTFSERQLVKKEIRSIINAQETVNVVDQLPKTDLIVDKSTDKLAYLIGAIASDGHIEVRHGKLAPRRGAVIFTQKPTAEKAEFIDTVNRYFVELFDKPMVAREKFSTSILRGRVIGGQAVDYRCYSLDIALRFTKLFSELAEFILRLDNFSALKFLAGLIDGDGAYHNNRLQIYIGKKNVLEAAVIACLKNGIVPQVTKNRNIFNVQIVEKLDEILQHTKRVKGYIWKKVLGTKLFAAKQVIGNIIDDVNVGGKIKPYIKNNLLIGADTLSKTLSKANSEQADQIKKILNSDLRMPRVKFVEDLGSIEVFNIEVDAQNELDHNYVVFSERYTPLLVSNSHAAIVSRERGLPCIVGCNDATETIKNKKFITVCCSEGEEGRIYEGKLKFKVDKISLKKIPKTRTKIMMNIGNPDEAFELSFLPNDGVGLAREEFIINEYIKIHPLALLNYDKLKDKDVKDKIKKLTKSYKNKSEFFVEKLAFGIAMIAAAFYPKPVIVRLSDFKSNEYRNLIGGKLFEPKEENPMLGWRGASRYYSKAYEKAFALECRAINKVRKDFGLKNVKVMVPMCRTVEEGKKVLKVMFDHGLKQHQDGLEVYVMCEVPSNVILASDFAKFFDGFSIGSNDLTQLTLGIDRDSELISHLFDERNPAVLKMIAEVIKVARKYNKKIGICGDSPSTYPEIVKFLVENHIDSMSLTPDAIIKVRMQVAKLEK